MARAQAITYNSLQKGYSAQGKAAFVVALVMIFSTDASYRIPIAGLLMHPYLLLAPLLTVVTPFRIFNAPPRILRPLTFFLVIFSLALLQDPSPLSEIFKLAAGVFTILFFTQAVQKKQDYPLIGFALLIVAAYISFVQIQIGMSGGPGIDRLDGINALEGLGNKNAQSLFTLPGFYFAMLNIPQHLRSKRWLRVGVLLSMMGLIMVGLILSGNRSGWVSAMLIVGIALAESGLTVRTLFILIVVAVLGYFAIEEYASDIFEHKLEVTSEGYDSDNKRVELLTNSLLIGLQNPFLGKGYEGVHRELAARLNKPGIEIVDSHNVYGYLLGGGGVFTFLAYFTFMYNSTRKYRVPYAVRGLYRYFTNRPHFLLRGFVLVYLLRAFFSRELLYSPTFLAMLGLLIGNVMYHYKEATVVKAEQEAAAAAEEETSNPEDAAA